MPSRLCFQGRRLFAPCDIKPSTKIATYLGIPDHITGLPESSSLSSPQDLAPSSSLPSLVEVTSTITSTGHGEELCTTRATGRNESTVVFAWKHVRWRRRRRRIVRKRKKAERPGARCDTYLRVRLTHARSSNTAVVSSTWRRQKKRRHKQGAERTRELKAADILQG